MGASLRVLPISASRRDGSTNVAVLRTVSALASEDVTTVLYAGLAAPPHFNPDGTYRKPIAWINASGPAAPTGGADAHDSLPKVLGYAHADIVEAGCTRIPVTRDAVGRDGTVIDPAGREQIAQPLITLVRHVTDRHRP